MKTKFVASKNDCLSEILHIGYCFPYKNQTVKLEIIPSGERNMFTLCLLTLPVKYATGVREKNGTRDREDGPVGTYFLCKHEQLSLDPQRSYKCLVVLRSPSEIPMLTS